MLKVTERKLQNNEHRFNSKSDELIRNVELLLQQKRRQQQVVRR